MKYSIIGLGKLGASMAAAIARRGHQVIGVDVRDASVDAVNAGRAPVDETDLAETIAANRDRLRATHAHREAVLASDVSFVVVPTPSNPAGDFSLTYAVHAFQALGEALAEKAGYHLVVMSSTVLPGATRYGLLPVLEQASGKKAGRDFGLCYSPEFIALGSVIHDFLNPDFTLVGEVDRRAGDLLEAAYAEIMENGAPCRRMSLENAELTKIAVNTFVTTKIAFANMIGEICGQLPGGDIDAVTHAMGGDARIGPKYLKGGLGYGGPCFPRDNVALGYIARALGVPARIAETTDALNRGFTERTLERLLPLLPTGATVAVLGLAYKPATPIVEESQSVELANALAAHGARVRVYDPLANETARLHLDARVAVAPTQAACLQEADVVMITTPDPAFRDLNAADLSAGAGRPVLVVDFWRRHAAAFDGQPGIRYVGFGRCRDDAAPADRLRTLWSGAVAGDGAATKAADLILAAARPR